LCIADRAAQAAPAAPDRAARAAAALDRARFWLLAALLFVLPILEGPKNILVALLAATLAARWVAGGMRLARPGAFELALLALLAASALSTAVNWPFENAGKGVKDVLFQLVVAAAALRGGFATRDLRRLGAAAVAGTVIGVAAGVAMVATGRNPLLELHSVGVATHSALYIAIMTMVALGLFLDPREAHPRAKWLWLAALGILLFGLAGTASRGAMLAFFAVLVVQLVATRHWRAIGTLTLMACLAAAAVFTAPDVFQQRRLVEKVEQTLRGGPLTESDRIRVTMWRIAIEQTRQGGTWLLGVGPRNYASIDFERLRFDPPLEIDPRGMLRHAHNLFLTKLVEEGALGLAALVALFAVVAVALVRGLVAGGREDWLWTAALGALLISIVAGSFNTPFYQEHALLAMILFGLALSRPWAAGRAS
jgi:O-antigen ligase